MLSLYIVTFFSLHSAFILSAVAFAVSITIPQITLIDINIIKWLKHLENMTIYRHNIRVEIDYIGIGKRIRIRRNMLGYSQEQLAFECDLSVPYISQIENGHKSVSLNALLQVADAMDCTLDWLVFGDSFPCSDFQKDEIRISVDNCTDEEKQYLHDLLNLNIRMMKSYRSSKKTPDTHSANISEA